VREWEQDRRKPEGAARVLLTVIKRDPDAVTQALADDVAQSAAPAGIAASKKVRARKAV
jgi:hypothetical protein